MSFLTKIKNNLFIRNAILAICFIVILIFFTQITLSLCTRHGQVIEVPDLNGMTYREAKNRSGNDFRFEINDSLYIPARTPGVILEQIPAPGSKVKSGRRIFVTINSFQPKMARVPYVTGYSLRQAKNNIQIAGFEIERLVYRQDIATNNVLEQKFNGQTVTPNSRIDAPAGSGITLIVGGDLGETVRIPRVVGFSLREAKSRLHEQGLNVGKIHMDNGVSDLNRNEAKVYRQEPDKDSFRNLGADIELYVTFDNSKIETGK
ncbi:MAG: PASTA domain-containing protein [Rikenellaceae bacterium]|nr:PASTA domain-containing protein [Rikenellaceae bacterium]